MMNPPGEDGFFDANNTWHANRSVPVTKWCRLVYMGEIEVINPIGVRLKGSIRLLLRYDAALIGYESAEIIFEGVSYKVIEVERVPGPRQGYLEFICSREERG